MAWLPAAKDLRARRDRGDELRRAGRVDEAVEEYRVLMRELVAEGLRLRASAACRLVLELVPGDVEARETLRAITEKRDERDEGDDATAIEHDTLEVQPADVVFEAISDPPRTPPPLPPEADDHELRLLVARGARLFAGLPDEVGDAVAAALSPCVLPAGSPLVRAAQACPGLYAIEAGEVDVRGGAGGVLPRRVGPGHVVGEMCALPGNVASGDVLAHTAVTALFLPREALASLAAGHAALGARLAKLSVCRRAFQETLRPDFPSALVRDGAA